MKKVKILLNELRESNEDSTRLSFAHVVAQSFFYLVVSALSINHATSRANEILLRNIFQ